MPHDFPLITLIAVGFTAAWILGLITQRLRLSPIVGYLLAGVAIGPYTPGFSGDSALASQLAEVGVILLMFGVGLHFHLKDLLAVRGVALPGAIGQSAFATLLGIAVAISFGLSLKAGAVLGMAMAVASTVVLMRVLMDNNVLDTTAGHVAVGWLIVEDVLTVIVLVMIPALGQSEGANLWATLGWALLKLSLLVAILLWGGGMVIPWIMVQVARVRSRELFTLTVLVMAIAIAAGSAYLFGASMALGAFLAGMVVGRSPVSNQAAADALPMRDAFAVLFFVSVGMLFDPKFVLHHPGMMLACLAIIMIGKPLAALLIVAVIGYPLRTGLTVALALAQIGEFSFILAELGHQHGLMDKDGRNVLIGCALVSITLNPLLFRMIGPLERLIAARPWLLRLLEGRSRRRESTMNEVEGQRLEAGESPLAVIVGYGPVGRTVDRILREGGLETVIVDLNMDTVTSLQSAGRLAIFGDAFNIEVLRQALPRATHLVISLPHSTNRNPLIIAAKLINPHLMVLVRARYVAEQEELMQAGADAACFEEAEAAVALGKLVLNERGADPDQVASEARRIRSDLVGETTEIR